MTDATQTHAPHRVMQADRVPPLASCATGSAGASAENDLARLLESITDRLLSGESIDLDALSAKHPEHADRLAELLPTIRAVATVGSAIAGYATDSASDLGANAGSSSSADHNSAVRTPHSALTLGDFRIRREIGRGGMGIVYEAEQLSLGRRVALKVLPFAGMLDERQLARFKNEARAAATLHHPNIVPVFSVGCERGVHFYAMQYIEGATLAAVIDAMRNDECGMRNDPVGNGLRAVPAMREDEATPLGGSGTPQRAFPTDTNSALRTPHSELDTVAAALSTLRTTKPRDFFRRVAELGIQAAEALDHAHQMGIVHRDIKPSNLMIDHFGKLWIADFGLAHFQNDAGMTMTGDLLGTLRYMSPEQALAKRVVVDHRADIYSLGVTLYELLTHQPAFEGTDREAVLRKIAFDEPAAPRKLNPAIPLDLETIVLKAMAKNPGERYATARELAQDLRQLVDDKPIRAKPPSLVQRARKWSRRHKAVIWPVAVALLVAVVALAGSIGWAVSDRSTRRLVAETAANVALDEATRLMQESKWPEARAAVSRAEDVLAVSEYHGASIGRADELRADIEMGIKLEGIEFRLNTFPKAEPTFHADDREKYHRLIDELYTQAFRQYGIDVDAAEPAQVADSIKARANRLDLAAALDRWSLCRRRSDGVGWQRLLTIACLADPDPMRCRLRNVSLLRPHEVNSAIRDLAKSLANEDLEPTSVRLFVPLLIEAREPHAAIMMLRRAQQQHPSDYHIAFTLAQRLHFNSSDSDEAIRYYSVALSLRADSAPAHNYLGNLLRERKQLDEARFHLEEAVRLSPNSPYTQWSLGILLMDQGLVDRAISCQRNAIHLDPHIRQSSIPFGPKATLDKSITAWKQVVSLDPHDGPAFFWLAVAYHAKGQHEEAKASCREAIRATPTDGHFHFYLASLLQMEQDLDGAIAHAREAIRLTPVDEEYYVRLGTCFIQVGLLNEAISQFKEARRLYPKQANTYLLLGACYWAKGLLDEALVEAKEALRLDPRLVDAHLSLAAIYEEKGLLDDAIAECKDIIELEPTYATGYRMLSTMLRKKGAAGEALVSVDEALRLEPNSAEAHAERAEVLVEKRQFDEALASANKAIRLGLNKHDGYCAAGNVLVAMGQVDKGIDNYMHALQLEPERPLPFQEIFCYRQDLRPQHLKQIYRAAVEVLEKNHVDQAVRERFSREAKAIMESKSSAASQESKK